MVPKLEAIKGGGGSIKIGTTGTISTLISRELQSTKSATQTAIATAVPIGATPPKRLMPRTSMDEASSSRSTINKKSPETIRKTKHYYRKTHQLPMLDSDSISLDGTPSRDKPDKRLSYIVEIVDINCGSRKTNRLKKLGFSKLSESIV